ncbi:hypothetical protein SDC9_105775 [bioreactor metagenome]|uniref:Uncharacterized protein n=1 Tax=bioreactor metagenome TaxID=1076179 RepID=A0A645B0I1_9ZZZZ
MGRCHQIDVMSTLGNKILINLLQLLYSYFFAKAFTADFMILTKNTVQVATAEKDSTGTACAADARFFPHMQSCAGYYWFHTTTTGTEGTA